MPKTIKVAIIDDCKQCPYLSDTHMYYDCNLVKDHRFDDDYPAIPSWCKLDSVQDIDWPGVIEEVEG